MVRIPCEASGHRRVRFVDRLYLAISETQIPATRESIFDIASLTKMITGTVAGTLIDEGILSQISLA